MRLGSLRNISAPRPAWFNAVITVSPARIRYEFQGPPNSAVNEFLKSWSDWNAAISSKGDEQGLLAAVGHASGLLYQPVDARFAGRELEDAPSDAVIVHHSATQDTTGGRFRRWFKRNRRVAGITRRAA